MIVSPHNYDGLRQLKAAAVRGLGMLDDWGEIRERLRPEAPSISADQFHPWVWDSARTFWESRHYRASVQQAASAINVHMQNKVGRRDVADDKLIGRCFSEREPTEGDPRLRMPGDHSDPTVQSVQRGAGQLGFACFWAIRNPATHETEEWPEHLALERLATLSVLARLIEHCDVVAFQA